MSPEKKTLEVKLNDRLAVFITITRAGQNPVWENDCVKVKGEILLPKNESGTLDEAVRFGDRIRIVDLSLTTSSGVYRYQYFSAAKWSEAFSIAEKYLTEQVQKLVNAVRKREQALIDAEND